MEEELRILDIREWLPRRLLEFMCREQEQLILQEDILNKLIMLLQILIRVVLSLLIRLLMLQVEERLLILLQVKTLKRNNNMQLKSSLH